MEQGTATAPFSAGVTRTDRPFARLRADRKLIERFLDGDEGAFALIYDRHKLRVFAVCMGVLGSREDAEDALQEAFARLAARLRRNGDRPHQLGPLLAKIARDAAIDMARARRPALDGGGREPRVACGPDQHLIRRFEFGQVMQGLRELPEEQRSALVMRELAGCSRSEIARTLGVDESAVRHLIERARIGLRAREEPDGLACSEVRRMLATEDDGRRRPAIVRRHLRSCSDCRDFRSALGSEARTLRGLAPAAGVGLTWRLALAARLPHDQQLLLTGMRPDGVLDQVIRLAAVGVLTLGALGGARDAALVAGQDRASPAGVERGFGPARMGQIPAVLGPTRPGRADPRGAARVPGRHGQATLPMPAPRQNSGERRGTPPSTPPSGPEAGSPDRAGRNEPARRSAQTPQGSHGQSPVPPSPSPGPAPPVEQPKLPTSPPSPPPTPRPPGTVNPGRTIRPPHAVVIRPGPGEVIDQPVVRLPAVPVVKPPGAPVVKPPAIPGPRP